MKRALLAVLALVVLAPAASAGRCTWDFTLDSGGIGSTADIYATVNFPEDNVPIGAEFKAFNQMISSVSGQDIRGDGIRTFGCSILEENVSPGTDDANYRAERLRVQMDGPVCSVSRDVSVHSSTGTLLYNHTFAFTIESFQSVEIGQQPGQGLTFFWLPLLLFLGVFVASLMRSWLLVSAWSLMSVLGFFYDAWPIGLTAGLIGLILVLALQAIADGAFGRRIRDTIGGKRD